MAEDKPNDNESKPGRFKVNEFSSHFEVEDTISGETAQMGDGVDTLFDDDDHPISPGTEGFAEMWADVLNADESETLEAYFPEVFAREEEGEQPEDGDLVTYDYQRFFEVGAHSVFDVKLGRRVKVEVPEDEDWRPHVKAYMDKQQFWPSVWFISDHGNLENLSLEV